MTLLDEFLADFVGVDTTSWRLEAACRDTDIRLFFPEQHDTRTTVTAKQICATCPVQPQCLAEGLMEEHGVWGGTTELERRKIRRARRRAAA